MPFILWKPLRFLYLWWRVDLWLKKQKFILLEIKMPIEILKPIRAMETVMNSIRQTIYAPPDFWEKWIDGQVQLSFAFEIVSLGGEPHFYIKIPADIKDSVEAAIYSQYPESEITEVEDYVKFVPQDIPNKDWDLWAADYRLLKPSPYPIKTYVDFETEHESKEEKRIDPVAGLLEAMAKVKPGEQLWIQILAQPVVNEIPWIKDGQKIRDILAKREKKEKPNRPLIFEAADILITGKIPGEEEKEESPFPPEMKLTPGERDVIAGLEKKISKPGFQTSIRFIFLGRKEVFNKANLRLPFGFFASYLTENMNGLVPWGNTLTKIHKSWFFPINYMTLKRRLYLRKRKIFKNYVRRDRPLFPRKPGDGAFVLNVEEMASLFHFPGRSAASAPYVARVEAKKGEAPPGLPVE